jgi:hypothetical protein
MTQVHQHNSSSSCVFGIERHQTSGQQHSIHDHKEEEEQDVLFHFGFLLHSSSTKNEMMLFLHSIKGKTKNCFLLLFSGGFFCRSHLLTNHFILLLIET